MYKIVHGLKCGGMMGSCKPNHYYSGENWKTVSRPDQVRPLSLYQANRPQFYLKIFNETEGEDRRGADVDTFHWHHLDILTTPPSYQTVKTWRLSASSTWLSRHTWSKRSGATSEMWLCDCVTVTCELEVRERLVRERVWRAGAGHWTPYGGTQYSPAPPHVTMITWDLPPTMILHLTLLVMLRGAAMVSVDPDMELPVRSDTEEDIYVFNSMNINPLVNILDYTGNIFSWITPHPPW